MIQTAVLAYRNEFVSSASGSLEVELVAPGLIGLLLERILLLETKFILFANGSTMIRASILVVLD